MRVLLAALLVMSLTGAGSVAYVDDPVVWAWRCASTGFYEMNVAPDGSYSPLFDKNYGGPLTITIRSDDQKIFDGCSRNGGFMKNRYVEITQASGEYFWNSGVPCDQQVQLRFGDAGAVPTLERVLASFNELHLMSLDLMRADADWRFVLSRSDVTTDREARKSRTYSTKPAPEIRPNAKVYFLSGECVQVK